MAKTKTFRCQVITPELALADVQATQVVLTAHDGELGVLHNRAPLLAKLGIGRCKVDTLEGTESYYIEGGFVQVLGNELAVLTQQAMRVNDIDFEAVKAELAAARCRETAGPVQAEARAKDIQKATTKLRLAGRN